jgi:hypothetical protein
MRLTEAHRVEAALGELLVSVEDVWRRHLAGDPLAVQASVLTASYRKACRALGRKPDVTLLGRIWLGWEWM